MTTFAHKARSRLLAWTGLALVSALFTGCVQTKTTEPTRSALEQLLLSTATDRAVASADFSVLRGKRVYFSTNYFEAYDAKYAMGTLREAANRAGAFLIDDPAKAEIILEPRSAALSIDGSTSLIGIPTTAVPVPLAGNFSLPEVALMKSQRQFSLANFALLAYSPRSGEHIYSSTNIVGRAYNHHYQYLWVIRHTSSDLPMRSTTKKGKTPKKEPSFTDPP